MPFRGKKERAIFKNEWECIILTGIDLRPQIVGLRPLLPCPFTDIDIHTAVAVRAVGGKKQLCLISG